MGCINSVCLFFLRSRWDVFIVSVCSFGGHDGVELMRSRFVLLGSRWDVLIVSVCSFGGHDGMY